jgi:hypothetical protein
MGDLAVALGDELYRGMLVPLLLPPYVVVERGVEEREDATEDPPALVLVAVCADHHATLHPAGS